MLHAGRAHLRAVPSCPSSASVYLPRPSPASHPATTPAPSFLARHAIGASPAAAAPGPPTASESVAPPAAAPLAARPRARAACRRARGRHGRADGEGCGPAQLAEDDCAGREMGCSGQDGCRVWEESVSRPRERVRVGPPQPARPCRMVQEGYRNSGHVDKGASIEQLELFAPMLAKVGRTLLKCQLYAVGDVIAFRLAGTFIDFDRGLQQSSSLKVRRRRCIRCHGPRRLDICKSGCIAAAGDWTAKNILALQFPNSSSCACTNRGV